MTHKQTPHYLGCPGCGAPAEIVDRFALDSTEGPLEHLKVWCVTGHWFTVLADNLPAAPTSPAKEQAPWTSQR
jgi:hypothetical protein